MHVLAGLEEFNCLKIKYNFMAFYEIAKRDHLDTSDKQASYFKVDINHFLGVCEGFGIDTGDLDRLAESAEEKIRKGNSLTDRESKMVGAIFVGDAEWHGAWSNWIQNSLIRIAGLLISGPIHKKMEDIAKQYSDLSELSIPEYSAPDDIRINDKPVLEEINEDKSAIMLKTAILHTDWFAYIADELGLDYDNGFIIRNKEEVAEYYTGRSDRLSDDIETFQYYLFKNDVRWLKYANKEMGLHSYFISKSITTYSCRLEEGF